MKIRIGTNRFEWNSLVSYGSKNLTVFDQLCAFLLTISPILQHYRGPIENAGFTVLVICFPILATRFVLNLSAGRIDRRCIIAIAPLLVFEFYTMLAHRVSVIKLFYIVFVFFLFLFIAGGSVNMTYFLRCAIGISCIAAVLLFVQYISYYCFRYPLDLRPFGLLLTDKDTVWISLSETTGAGRMLRPAAFFMEPSHLFLYSFPSLFVLLLTPDLTTWRRNRALLITAGMFLSTSGMGIVISLGVWMLYFFFYSKKRGKGWLIRLLTVPKTHQRKKGRKNWLRRLLSVRTLIIGGAIVVLAVAAYFAVPFLHKSINRIFIASGGSSTAISGRIRRASNYIKTIRGKAVIIGTPNVVSGLDFNRAGFFATYIRWGLIGLLTTYWFYLQGVFKLKNAYKWISIIIVVISFFTAHTHGTFYMLYYVVFLMEGYHALKQKTVVYAQTKDLLYG